MKPIQLSLSGRLWERSTGYLNTLEEQIPIVRQLGYDGLEIRYPLLPVGDAIASAKAKLEAANITPTITFCAGVPQDAASWEDAMRVVKTVSALGGRHVRIAFGKADALPAVRELVVRAQEFNVRVLVHFHVNTYCDTVAKAVEIMNFLNHPNAGLLFDPSHLIMAGDDDFAGATERLFQWIELVNIQDFRKDPNGEFPGYTSKWTRHLPLDPGGMPFAAFVDVLKKLGYKGFLNVMTAVGNDEDPIAIAKNYHQAFSQYLS